MTHAETERLVKFEEEADEAEKKRAQLPRDLLEEVATDCRTWRRTYQPREKKKRKKVKLSVPHAACKLAIFSTEDAQEDLATLAVQVCSGKNTITLGHLATTLCAHKFSA